MPNHSTSPLIRRTSTLAAAAVVLVAVVAAGIGTVATAGPAGAAGGTTTYSATTIRPGPLPAAYGSSANSDGWAVALSSTQVFNVTHHLAQLDVTCHNQSNGSPCWTPDQTKVITNGSNNYVTPLGAGLYLDQSTGHLFTYAVQVGPTGPTFGTAGVVCIDTSNPVTASFCGFTALSAAGESPIPTGQYAGISAPVQVGNNWYAFNTVSGVGAGGGTHGTENTLMCFSLTSFQACPTTNYTIPFSGPAQVVLGAAAPAGASGSDVFIPLNTGTGGNIDQMLCFDTSSAVTPFCGSAWPVSLSNIAGSPFPLLNGAGAATGVCVPISGVPCVNFQGATVPTPGSLASVVGLTGKPNGPAVAIGTRVYVPNYTTGAVDCFNFATGASCANFPKALQGLTDLYTVNQDPYRANCIWVNSDNGPAQIQNFNATTGGQCDPGPVRLQASSLISSDPACTVATSYQSLQILSPARSTYSSATVQFADSNGTYLSNPGPVNVDAFGGFNLGGYSPSGSNSPPQFVVTFSGLASTPTTVSLKLTWQAAASSAPQCVAGGQSSTTAPGYWMVATDGGIFNYGNAGFFGSTGALHLNQPIVGMALNPDHQGYWLVAADGGVFNYGDAGFFGSTGALHLNQPIVGMAATSTGHGYWLVARDGGIFNFGDAGFFGSAGNLRLNKPVVGMAATPDGGGYWLVAADGGIFTYGDAQFYGSTGNLTLNKPVVGMAANPNGGGYWMVATDGGIFAYGAGFYGSTGNLVLNKPVVGMAPLFDSTGYWLAASDGGIFNYGNAGFAGSAGGLRLNKPIVGIAA